MIYRERKQLGKMRNLGEKGSEGGRTGYRKWEVLTPPIPPPPYQTIHNKKQLKQMQTKKL